MVMAVEETATEAMTDAADSDIPRGYKQTDVGVIPEDWDVKDLRSMTRSHNSGIYKRQAIYGHGCNIVGVSDIYGIDKVDGQSFAYVPLSSQERAKHTLHCDDLLYGESSLVREGIARTVYVTGRGAGTAFAWHTRRYSVEQRMLLSSYLYYYLQSRPARAHMVNQSIQTAITGINTVAYFACPITVPPFAEQEAIAEALSDVDALIEFQEQLVAKKHQIKQGAMQELLTGKKRLPGFTHGDSSYRPTKFGMMPADWAPTSLERIAAFITKGSTPTTYGFSWQDAGVLFLRSECVSEQGLDLSQSMFISDKAHQVLRRSDVRAGDILMTITGNVGRVVHLGSDFGEANINQHIARIRIIDERVADAYVFHFLSQPVVRKYFNLIITGQAYPQISLKQVRETELRMPTFVEQQSIAEVLSDMDADIAALEAKLTKTRILKQGMMQELLTGRIRLV